MTLTEGHLNRFNVTEKINFIICIRFIPFLWNHDLTQSHLDNFKVTESHMKKHQKFLFHKKIVYDFRMCRDFDEGHLGKFNIFGGKKVKLVASLYLSYGKILKFLTLHKDCI